MTKEDTIMGNNGRTYRGVPVPDQLRKAEVTGFQDDPYVLGWRDGVDAAVGAGTGVTPDENTDNWFRGVPVPDRYAGQLGLLSAWQDGVTSAYLEWIEKQGLPRVLRPGQGQDTTADSGQTDEAPEIGVLRAVMEERTRDAKRDVLALSPRDRAVLSFWLQEALSLVEDIEVSRRLVR